MLEKLKKIFQINKGILLLMLSQFLILFILILKLEFHVYLTVIFGYLFTINVLFIIKILKKNTKSYKRMKNFSFVSMMILGLSFVVFLNVSIQSNVQGEIFHWESSQNYSDSKAFAIPDYTYYYINHDLSTGEKIDIHVNYTFNLKPENLKIIVARGNNIYQLDDDFENTTERYYTYEDNITESFREINALNTKVYSLNDTFSFTRIPDVEFKQYIFFRLESDINETWMGGVYISYLWSEINITSEVNGIEELPARSGVSYNTFSLEQSVEDTWWMVSLVILIIWVIAFLISLISNKPNMLWLITIMLTAVSMSALIIMVGIELNKNWWQNWIEPFRSIGQFLAIMIGAIKWIISLGLALSAIGIGTMAFTKLMDASAGGGTPKSGGGGKDEAYWESQRAGRDVTPTVPVEARD